MKIFILLLCLSVSCFAGQSTNTFTLQPGNTINFPVKGVFNIVSLSVISSPTNFASVDFIDSATSNIAYIQAATTNTTQLLYTWTVTGTNGDGSTFSSVNNAYVPVTTIFSAKTNLFPVIFSFFTLTNQSVVTLTNTLVGCQSGFTASNSGPGPVTVVDVTTNAPPIIINQ